MNKKTISLLLSIVLMFSLAVPVAMADDTASVAENCDCGTTTDEHDISCFSRCKCADSNHVPANEYDHITTCPLYKCTGAGCGVYLNQGESHSKNCHTLCDCGYPEETHTPDCWIYNCEYCLVYPNQGEAHTHYTCPDFACPDCGKVFRQEGTTEGCMCYYFCLYNSVYDEDGNYLEGAGVEADVYEIAFVDKSQATITLFNENVGTFGNDYNSYETLNTADCPDVLIVRDRYKVGAEPKYYEITCFDIDFYDNHAGYYQFVEAKHLNVRSTAAGLYATFAPMDGGDTMNLYDENGNSVEVDASLLAGEYVVAEFDGDEWQFKLTTDENWPVDAAYCWINADNLLTLSEDPTQQPTEPDEPEEPQAPTHSEGCGDECTVEGCTCVCHNALLQRFYTATNLEELDDMMQAATEEEWNAFPEEAWPWLDAFAVTLPSIYDPVESEPDSDVPVESEVCWVTVTVSNAAGLRPPVTGQ